MVAIAIDRYLCICHPWLSAQLMNQSRAKQVVVALAVFSAAIGVCVALMYGVFTSVYLPPNYQNLTTAELAAIIQAAEKYVNTASSSSSSSSSFCLFIFKFNPFTADPVNVLHVITLV